MSSHDEYSSDEEEPFDENSKSEVFLGFVDVPVEESDDEPTIEDTFIGGKPVWLHPDSPPDNKYITCDNCGKTMALYLQAFAPFDGKLYDRVIYIFGCKNTSQCSNKKGSIKAIRGISKDPERMESLRKEEEEVLRKDLDQKLRLENKKKIQIEMTKDLFGKSTSSNPFGGQENPFGNSFGTGNPFAKEDVKEKDVKEVKKDGKEIKKPSYAEVVKPAPKVSKKSSSKPLPSYFGNFLYVEQEKFKKEKLDSELEKYKHLIDMDVEKESGSGRRGSMSSQTSGAALDPQNAKISNMLDDKYFEAFSNTVKHNPGQVLRYCMGGRPLLYSGRDDIAKKFAGDQWTLPNPGYNPSSQRQFELQLMPKCIIDLEQIATASITDILNGMSWGTIIVCTDVEDYIPEDNFDENNVAYIEEWCGVQWEESV